jgi:protein-disulfide isomerase
VLSAAVFLLRPSGPITQWWNDVRSQRAAEAYLESNWELISQAGSWIGAAPGSGTVIVEFSDYECPFCRKAHGSVEEALLRDSEISVVYRHLPLTGLHPRAEAAALASICAEEQDRFGPVHRLLMETEEWLIDQDWRLVAEQGGVADLDKFEECLAGDTARLRLEGDVEMAARLGISGTPTFVTDDRMESGAPDSVEELLALLVLGDGS